MMPVAVWHGSGDKLVNPVNGDGVLRQFARYNDLADDGQANGSIGTQAPELRNGQVVRRTRNRLSAGNSSSSVMRTPSAARKGSTPR